jgi:phosphopantothenoylcysteine decarboxylase / phosphopantothenate---cysteine ligase
MHPSRAIRGQRSQLLEGRRIVIGVTGSISAVEVVRIIRELIRHGADVKAAMSPDAGRIVTPEALQFATGHPVVTNLTGDVEHVSLMGRGPDRADLYLIAPATANTLSKISHGIDDTVVTAFASVALGTSVPILVAPAMHQGMGENPAVRENLDRLKSWGVGVIAATSAEGEEKLASPEEVSAAVLRRLAQGPWAGRRILVIGGASREAVDDVRSITNESSGETAVQLAIQAYYRGADVGLWLGAATAQPPPFIPSQRWRSVQGLVDLIQGHAEDIRGNAAIFVPAAISDYTLSPRAGKISSRENPTLQLELTRAPKVLPLLREAAPGPTCLVAFKLEAASTEADLEASARRLASEVQSDWVVADTPESMGSDEGKWLVIHGGGPGHRFVGGKSGLAVYLLKEVGDSLPPSLARAPAAAKRGRRGTVSRN